MSITLQVLLLSAGLLALFSVAFVVSSKLDNYGFVDVVWALSFTPAALFLSFVSEGYLQRRLLLVVLVGSWSLRLGLHLLRRVSALHPVEDGRYAELRRAWALHLNRSMFVFFLAQAVLVVVLCSLLLPSMNYAAPSLHWLEYLAAGIFILAVLGEAIADAQLRRFKSLASNHGRVCDIGLWSLSRHPNYFFEWLVWLALALFCLTSPWGWLALLAPVLMHHFLYRVTGIPYTEKQLLKSKGAAYTAYQQRVPAFYPNFFRRPIKAPLQ